ncbi:hypothetical protein LENED_005325 [Lentinula edodes]|uniref:Uncharacterized protein n=1 Tax=Lentinula edodes TaxID=5353 RepID=A0A1Q3E8U7_LENED|nr:hypothetical protein LENED_005325 [Lentinula edodes]
MGQCLTSTIPPSGEPKKQRIKLSKGRRDSSSHLFQFIHPVHYCVFITHAVYFGRRFFACPLDASCACIQIWYPSFILAISLVRNFIFNANGFDNLLSTAL